MSEDIIFDAETLRNRGVPARFATVQPIFPQLGELTLEQLQARGVDIQPIGWERVLDAAGELVTAEHHVRFDVNALADLEVEFGSLRAWQESAKERSVDTCRRTFAIVFGGTARQWGTAMIADDLLLYQSAMGAAWAMANGVDPQTVAESMNQQSSVRAAVAAVNQADAEQVMQVSSETVSTTRSGSEAG